MRSKILLALVPAAAALALAGCGDAEPSTPTAAPTAAAPVTDAAAPAAEPAAAPATRAAPPDPLVIGEPLDPVGAEGLVIEPGGYAFGVVPPSTAILQQVTLRNTSTEPMQIVQAKPSCLCTAPLNVAGAIIQPNQALALPFEFKTPPTPGEKSAQIDVVFRRGRQGGRAVVRLSADVTMPVRATPAYVDALKGVTSGTIRLEPLDGEPFRVISSNGEPPVFADAGAVGEARAVQLVQWTVPLRAAPDCEGARLWWVIETDRADCPVIPLRIRHECTGSLADPERRQRQWVFDDYIAPFGALAPGKPVEVDVELVSTGADIDITAVRSLDPRATAELVEVVPGIDQNVTCRVRFTPAADHRGILYAMVLFESPTGDMDMAFIGSVR